MNFLKGFSVKGLIPIILVWLFGLYPVAALYANNAGLLLPGQIVLPAIISVALSTLLFCILLLIMRNQAQASISTILLLLPIWYYGFIFQGITGIIGLKHWHLIPVLFFIAFHLIYLISKVKKPKTLANLITILFYPVLILLVFNVVKIFGVELKKNKEINASQNPVKSGSDATRSKQYPDIYLIIFDEYASIRTIKEEWGYDNNQLSDFLQTNGFFVPKRSMTRYNQTIWNITTLLNLNYLSDPVEQSVYMDYVYDPNIDRKNPVYKSLVKVGDPDLFQKFNNNLIFSYFKKHGYKIVVLEGISQYYSTAKFKNADQKFSYQQVEKSAKLGFSLDAFSRELIRNSVIFPFEMTFKIDQSNSNNYTGTKYVLDFLKNEVHKVKGPKFTYAHIMCPHAPYVFDHSGNYINPITVAGQRDGAFVVPKNIVNGPYLEHYLFVSDQIKELVTSILKYKPSVDPVIIIQSDHGPRPSEVFLKNRGNSFTVFSSVYFPGGNYSNLHDSIAPVNTLRVLLNQFFGENYNMLEDR